MNWQDIFRGNQAKRDAEAELKRLEYERLEAMNKAQIEETRRREAFAQAQRASQPSQYIITSPNPSGMVTNIPGQNILGGGFSTQSWNIQHSTMTKPDNNSLSDRIKVDMIYNHLRNIGLTEVSSTVLHEVHKRLRHDLLQNLQKEEVKQPRKKLEL